MPLFILAIAPNGPATSLLTVGDEILEINDFPTTGLTHSEAVRLISQGGPSVKLRLRRNLTAGGLNELFQGGTPTAFSPSSSFVGRIGTPTTPQHPQLPTVVHSPNNNGQQAIHMQLSPSPTHPQVPFSSSHQSMGPLGMQSVGRSVPSPNMMIGGEYQNY